VPQDLQLLAVLLDDHAGDVRRLGLGLRRQLLVLGLRAADDGLLLGHAELLPGRQVVDVALHVDVAAALEAGLLLATSATGARSSSLGFSVPSTKPVRSRPPKCLKQWISSTTVAASPSAVRMSRASAKLASWLAEWRWKNRSAGVEGAQRAPSRIILKGARCLGLGLATTSSQACAPMPIAQTGIGRLARLATSTARFSSAPPSLRTAGPPPGLTSIVRKSPKLPDSGRMADWGRAMVLGSLEEGARGG
jgi:hypothetical protein